jgi:hypothetical protein
MQVPVCLTIRNGLHALTRRFVTEILVSSLATLLVMAIFRISLCPGRRAADVR